MNRKCWRGRWHEVCDGGGGRGSEKESEEAQKDDDSDKGMEKSRRRGCLQAYSLSNYALKAWTEFFELKSKSLYFNLLLH